MFVPGPYKWHCEYDEDEHPKECSVGKITSWGGYFIAVISDDVPEGEREGTARLLHAAPDMHKALKYARRFLNENDCDIEFIDKIIQKAEGKS